MTENDEKRWLCECACHNLTCVDGYYLRQGKTKSCGCNVGIATAEAQRIDLTGQRFGRLTVIRPIFDKEKHCTLQECLCDCGNTVYVKYGKLTQAKQPTRSCGCLRVDTNHARAKDITGQRFGALTALAPAGRTDHPTRPRTLWKCRCELCGKEINVLLDSLIQGKQFSCGCQNSIGEYNIQRILQENNIPFVAQQTFSELIGINGGLLRYDFAILDSNQNVIRLIEFDGPQHQREYQKFGDYEITHEHDLRKNAYAAQHNIPLIRIPYSERDTLTLEKLMGDSFLYKEAD